MAAISYFFKRSETNFHNWTKASLAVLITKEGIEPFVYNEIEQFQQKCLADICNNNGLPAGTVCSSCCTENVVVCPMNRICNVGRGKCNFHKTSAKQYLPSGCPIKICHNFKNEIQKAHRYSGPSYKNTDASQWCSNPWEVAKCFMPPDGYSDVASAEETDFSGIISVIINNNAFQSKVKDDISIKIFEQARDINKMIRHAPNSEVKDSELNQIFSTLHSLLSDPAYLFTNTAAQNARTKLLELQNDTSIIGDDYVQKMLYQRAFGLRENVIRESVPPSYSSKYESEFVHKLVLGSGAFGVVFEAENRVDKCSYAVKRITLHKSDTLQDNINREVTALSKLEHPNIVRYFQAWPETPPPGWQEQKDQQRGISESSSSFSFSSASVNKADTDDGSPSPNTTPPNRDGDNDKKGLTDLFSYPFGTADPFQISSFSRREGSDSWGSDNGTTSDESSERQKPKEAYTKESITSKYDQQNEKLKTKIKQKELGENKDIKKKKLFLYIQMELCKPETLKQWLDENRHERSSEKQNVLDWFNQICSAVKYMHENGFVHRDLKPSNIFFSAKDVVKVGDFGFATALEEDQYLETYSEAGTYLYMAPEVLEKCHKKSNKVDIYSLGVILFELLYSFGTQNERIKTLENIRKLQFPENFKGDMPEKEQLVSKMLAKIPEERPSAEEILNEIMKTAAP